MFNVSLGGANPRPSTCLGTIATAALPAATLVRNSRRDISLFSLLVSLFFSFLGFLSIVRFIDVSPVLAVHYAPGHGRFATLFWWTEWGFCGLPFDGLVLDLKTLEITARISTGSGPDGMAWAVRH
jgi:hypothetical protein